MFKKCVIFLFLTTAYSVLLAHNFTPHIHHSDPQTHQHEDGDQHHHNDTDNGPDDENSTSPFHLLQHIGGSVIVFIPEQFVQTEIQKKTFESSSIKDFDFVSKQLAKPPLILPASRKQYLLLPKAIPYFFLLKAPPAFTA